MTIGRTRFSLSHRRSAKNRQITETAWYHRSYTDAKKTWYDEGSSPIKVPARDAMVHRVGTAARFNGGKVKESKGPSTRVDGSVRKYP